jgi:hypothetical protein
MSNVSQLGRRSSGNACIAEEEIGRHRRQPIAVVLGPTVFNRQVLTLDVAGFFQPLPKPRDTKGVGLRRTRAQIADH